MNLIACNPMIEDYFSQLDARMADLPASERREFARELRAHVLDRLEQAATPTQADCRTVLKALGAPEEIARQYRLERIMNRSAWKTSPLSVLRLLLRWTITGIQGYVVFMVAFTGYLMAACFYVSAVLKPFFPHNVGFFVGSQGLQIADWPAPHMTARLDNYFIPISIVIGYLLTVGTTLLIRFIMQRFGKLKQKI